MSMAAKVLSGWHVSGACQWLVAHQWGGGFGFGPDMVYCQQMGVSSISGKLQVLITHETASAPKLLGVFSLAAK